MQNKMSARKQRIAKRLEALGMIFDGQKVNGRYVINSVACRTLDEVEEYVKTLEDANAQQSVAEAGFVETVAPISKNGKTRFKFSWTTRRGDTKSTTIEAANELVARREFHKGWPRKIAFRVEAQQSVAEIEPVSNPHCIKAACKECKRIFKHFELKHGMCYCCYEQLEVSKVLRDQQAIEAAYRLHEPIERRLLDECVARAKKLGRPFTEREVFQQAWDKGYELMPAMDRRFVLVAESINGMPLWGLVGA